MGGVYALCLLLQLQQPLFLLVLVNVHGPHPLKCSQNAKLVAV